MSVVEPAVGAKVSVPPGVGVVRFIGSTSFAAGKWVGIELEEPKGKNDGSVAGVQYFSCRMNYGVFVRPSQVKVVSLLAYEEAIDILMSDIAGASSNSWSDKS